MALFGPHPGLSGGLSLFLFFTGFWFMPLLFWLAGSSSWYALQKRGAGQYGRERALRLLVPFAFGLLFIVPPQAYFARLMQGWSGGFLDFLSAYFTDFTDLSGYYGTFTPAHLWFILYLFVISIGVLPLLLAIRRRVAKTAEGRTASALFRWLAKPAVFLLLCVPLTLAEALPDIGGKNPFYYCAIFLLAYLAACADGMQKTIERLRRPSLAALPPLLALYYLMAFRWDFGACPDFSVQQAAMALVRNLAMLLTLAALLGYGKRFLNRDAPALPYMNRAAFPVYILHQTVLIAVAYYAVQWALPVWAKFLLITVLSFVATMGIYEMLVRRVGFMRFLFGVK